MKKIVFLIGILCACNVAIFSQGNEIDAYTLSNTELSGTARSMAMGGAFGALGGDMSALSANPAGLGIYRSSEVNGTLGLSMVNTSSNWYGINTNSKKTSFTPDNIGFELYMPTASGSILNWNVGFSYNRVKNFNRDYRMRNSGMPNSMADYIGFLATNAFGYNKGISESEFLNNPYTNSNLQGNWLPILGYDSYFINDNEGNNYWSSIFGEYKPVKTGLRMSERGHVDEMNFGIGTNISNILYLGASLSVTDMDYKLYSDYEEYNELNDQMYLENWLTTTGKGYSVNVGAILNLQMIRLGVAYNSPRWYKMTDYFDARGESFLDGVDDEPFIAYTPENCYNNYSFRTPGKWIFSGAIIPCKESVYISVDYEITNYKGMHFSDEDGYDNGFYVNDNIEADFGISHTLKLGAELKITPQFAIRGGYIMQTNPINSKVVNNDVEIAPSGTIPHFAAQSKTTNYYTAGLGYRFTPNFYMDLACVYKVSNDNVYAFSNGYLANNKLDVGSEAGLLKTNYTKVLLTLGYKF
jgi:long-subunit fatty acid transport protein